MVWAMSLRIDHKAHQLPQGPSAQTKHKIHGNPRNTRRPCPCAVPTCLPASGGPSQLQSIRLAGQLDSTAAAAMSRGAGQGRSSNKRPGHQGNRTRSNNRIHSRQRSVLLVDKAGTTNLCRGKAARVASPVCTPSR